MQIDKRNTLQKVRIRGQDKLPHHNGDWKKKVIDKNNEKCYFVEVVIQFVHSRVTTEEIENRICDLNNVGCWKSSAWMAKYTQKYLGCFCCLYGKIFCLEKETGGEFIYEIYPRYLLSTVDTTVSRLCWG